MNRNKQIQIIRAINSILKPCERISEDDFKLRHDYSFCESKIILRITYRNPRAEQ